MILFAALTLAVANFVPLAAIATMGSAGFLLVFLFVNVANCKLRRETGGTWWISIVAVLACLIALSALVWKTLVTPGQAWQVFVLVGMVVSSLLIEWLYRISSGRSIVLRHLQAPAEDPPPSGP